MEPQRTYLIGLPRTYYDQVVSSLDAGEDSVAITGRSGKVTHVIRRAGDLVEEETGKKVVIHEEFVGNVQDGVEVEMNDYARDLAKDSFVPVNGDGPIFERFCILVDMSTETAHYYDRKTGEYVIETPAPKDVIQTLSNSET